MTPRAHQQAMLDGCERGWKEFRKLLAVCPTGGGKTPFLAWEAQRHLPGRTLILAHREELIDQAIDKVWQAIGVRADKEKADSHASLTAPIVVGSIQTLCRASRRERWPRDHFSLVVVDEAHHALADSYRGVLGHFDSHARVLGVTATPDRGDKRNLGEYFENVAAEINFFDLVNAGHLSTIITQCLPVKIDLSDVSQLRGDFNETDLDHALEPYLGEIAREIKQHAGNRRTLAFLPLIGTSQKFVSACRAAGLSAMHVDGESPDRREILERFAGWEFDVLSNAMLLTEGFDDPSIDCVCILRPTKSRPLYAQMVGRGTRVDGFKENLLLLDFLWLSQNHKVTRPAHLIASSEEEAEAMTEITEERAGLPAEIADQLSFDLRTIASAAAAKREANLAKKLSEQRNKKGKFVSAEEFALQHHSLEVAEFEPTMKWESNAITPKQAGVLKRAKIEVGSVRGRGHASKLIDLIFRNQKLTLASAGQRRLMGRMGHPNADQATEAEARQFFSGLRR